MTSLMHHEGFIRQCLELAISAGKKGNHTFGALLVDEDQVILTAENTVRTDQDSTRHAELNLIVKGERTLPSEVLKRSTLYTSTAPCQMCATVIWSAGITKIVYSVSYEAFAKLIPGGYRYIPCDEVYQRLGSVLDLQGPILEEEGLQVFQYWT
jgi:tRNA(Arg) A34 adenosine deaminase TadA